jgi:hypothetical protein
MHSFTSRYKAPKTNAETITLGLSQVGVAGMSFRMTNRFYQVLSMVALLLAAVVLTTALVVAAERNSENSKKPVWHKSTVEVPCSKLLGPKEWV